MSCGALLRFASFCFILCGQDCLNFHKLLGCTCQTTGRRLSSHERLSSSSKETLNLEDSDHKRNEGLYHIQYLESNPSLLFTINLKVDTVLFSFT